MKNIFKVYVVLCGILVTASVMKAMELSDKLMQQNAQGNSSLQLISEKKPRYIPQTNIFVEHKNKYFSIANNGRCSNEGVIKKQINTFYGGNLLINEKGVFIQAYQIMNNTEEVSRRFSEEERFLVPITVTQRQFGVIEDIVDYEDEESGQDNIIVIDNLNNFYRIIGIENYGIEYLKDESSSLKSESLQLQSQEFVSKSNELKKLTDNRKKSINKFILVGGISFIIFCVALSYKYGLLPSLV